MKNKDRKNKGFTLIEALVAIFVIALTIVALMVSSQAFTMANVAGVDMSTAEFLIEEIRELTAVMPVIDPQTETDVFGPETGETLTLYDDLDDFDNAVFSPPIDINRAQMTNYSGFTQQITVQNVNPSNYRTVVSDHSSDFVKVTVAILLDGQQLSSTTWIRARQ